MGIMDDIGQAFSDIGETIKNTMSAMTGGEKSEAMASLAQVATQQGQNVSPPMANISLASVKEQAQEIAGGLDVLNVGETDIEAKSPDAAKGKGAVKEESLSL